MRQERRIDEVDVLRESAALLMILGHSFIVYPIDISGIPWCKALQHFIYTFHMELFFVLAGVIYQCIDYREFIGNKIKRILVPVCIIFDFCGLPVDGKNPRYTLEESRICAGDVNTGRDYQIARYFYVS